MTCEHRAVYATTLSVNPNAEIVIFEAHYGLPMLLFGATDVGCVAGPFVGVMTTERGRDFCGGWDSVLQAARSVAIQGALNNAHEERRRLAYRGARRK